MIPLFLRRHPTAEEHKTCLMLEQNMVVSPSSLKMYRAMLQEKATSNLGEVGNAPVALLVFIGLAQGGGLAALRAAVRAETAVDILAVFTQGFPTSGGSSMFIDDSGLIPQLDCTPHKSVVEKGAVMGRGVLTAAAVLTGAVVGFTTSAVIGLSVWLVNLVVDFKGGGHGVRLRNVGQGAGWAGLLGGVFSGAAVYTVLGGRLGLECEAGVGTMPSGLNICVKSLGWKRPGRFNCPNSRKRATVSCAYDDKMFKGVLTWESDTPCE